MTLKLSRNLTRTSPLFIFCPTMSDLRRDPLYNTLNEFDFIVFVQLETELGSIQNFRSMSPPPYHPAQISDCDWEGVLLYFASQDSLAWQSQGWLADSQHLFVVSIISLEMTPSLPNKDQNENTDGHDQPFKPGFLWSGRRRTVLLCWAWHW